MSSSLVWIGIIPAVIEAICVIISSPRDWDLSTTFDLSKKSYQPKQLMFLCHNFLTVGCGNDSKVSMLFYEVC